MTQGPRSGASATDTHVLELDGVSKRFGSVVAVDRLSLHVEEGRFVAIMGPSGCGKTTTLRLLAGLESPDEGEIRYFGARVNDQRPWERSVPMVWQNLALFPFLSVTENVEFGLRMHRVARAERRRRARDWLERMEIAELAERRVSELSGGQLQRVALARSLVLEPRMLLLDEPLSALDAHLRIRMQDVLMKLQRELNITFCYVTHSQTEAFAMADRVVIMNRGRIEQDGSPSEIFERPATAFVAGFVGAHNLIDGRVESVSGDQVRVETPLGLLVASRSHSGGAPASGEPVTLAVRVNGSRISATRNESDAENAVRARIIGEEFNGAFIIYSVVSSAGDIFRVQRHVREAARAALEHNQEVFIEWSAQDCFPLLGGDRAAAVQSQLKH